MGFVSDIGLRCGSRFKSGSPSQVMENFSKASKTKSIPKRDIAYSIAAQKVSVPFVSWMMLPSGKRIFKPNTLCLGLKLVCGRLVTLFVFFCDTLSATMPPPFEMIFSCSVSVFRKSLVNFSAICFKYGSNASSIKCYSSCLSISCPRCVCGLRS